MKLAPGTMLDGRWKIERKLSSGSYANIYLARCFKGLQYAIKLDEVWWISNEKRIYNILQSAPISTPGIPKLFDHGTKDGLGYLVLPRLGVSLHSLWVMCRRRFTHSTIAKIAVQAIRRLQFVHSAGVVHGDVTARNFVMGSDGNESTIYLIDYGNAKKFTHELRGDRFVPLDSYTEVICPREDLRKLIKMLISFHRGDCRLWMREREQAEKRGLTKLLSCFLPTAPAVRSQEVRHYWQYVQYVDQLPSTEIPDYRYLEGIFWDYLASIGASFTDDFQWMDLKAYQHSMRM